MLFLVQAHTRKNCLCSYFPSSSKLVLRRAWGKAGTCTSVLARQDKTQATGVHPHVTQALIYAPECWEHVNKTKNPNELVQGVLDRHLPVNQSVFTSPPAAPAWDASTFTAPRFNFPKSVQLTSCRYLSPQWPSARRARTWRVGLETRTVPWDELRKRLQEGWAHLLSSGYKGQWQPMHQQCTKCLHKNKPEHLHSQSVMARQTRCYFPLWKRKK